MAALETRGHVASTEAFYLCPLSVMQVSAPELQRLLQPVWEGKQTVTVVHGRRRMRPKCPKKWPGVLSTP